MKKVLLLDTNVSSYPIFQFLEKTGLEVFVVGKNPNDFLAKFTKNFIDADYSDIKVLVDIIEQHEFDYLVPGCNDLSYLMASRVNGIKDRYYNIESVETTEIINDKDKFKELAHLIGLPVTRMYTQTQAAEVRPIIVKPIDTYSGRGVSIIHEQGQHHLADAVEKVKKFSRSGKYIIEDFVQGQLHSHTAFISEGKMVIDFIVEEHCTANPFVVDTSRVVYDFSEEILFRIRESILNMIGHLNLKNGLIHTQFILRDDSFWFLEITKRCPGDLYSKLIELSTGFPYAEFYTRPFLDLPLIWGDGAMKRGLVLRHTVSERNDNLFSSIKFNYPVNLEELFQLTLAGSPVKASPFDKMALIFLRCNSDEEFLKLWNVSLQRELYHF